MAMARVLLADLVDLRDGVIWTRMVAVRWSPRNHGRLSSVPMPHIAEVPYLSEPPRC